MVSINELSPIILIVYNRVKHTESVIDALLKNDLASDSILYVYSDDSKCLADEEGVHEVREYIKSIDGFRKVIIILREKNFGLASNMVSSVTEVLKKHGRAIILEDDDVPSRYFLDYMNKALTIYEYNQNVMSITGYMFPISSVGLEQTLFGRLPASWGWATWSRAWKYFDHDRNAAKLMNKFSPKMKKSLNFDNAAYFWGQLKGNKQNKIDTWGVFWYVTVFMNKGLTLYPSKSLINNVGNDGSGEHCGGTDVYNVALSDEKIEYFELDIKENEIAYTRLQKYFSAQMPSIFTRIFNKIMRLWV